LNKSALSALSEGLIFELAHTGVRVVDVRPGDFASDFHAATRRVGAELAGAYAPNLERAWNTVDKNMTGAQSPQAVADLLVKIVEGRTRGTVQAVGNVFQARIAPFLARLAPRAWVQWGVQVYYGLKRGI
jgi:NAD(P)-dependent dehydrogenase (short-subunit alcohol dehydrogenase family)